MAMDQAQTFEWLRERSTRLDQAEATIAELQREIEGLRAVSEQQQQRAQLAEERVAALKGALEREKRSEWREGLVAVIDHEGNYLGCMGTMTWAVLAGKEAQG